MRRGIVPALVIGAGLVVLVDYLVVNPSVDVVGGYLLSYLIALAAAAGVAGGVEVVAAQVIHLRERRRDPTAAVATLVGFLLAVGAGFYPGSAGASDPAMRWIVAAMLLPLVASLFSLLFFFMLAAVSRGLRLRGRETTVIVAAAAAMLVLLLPLGGDVGRSLASAAGWTLDVPVGAVFRGLLIGVAIATSVAAARTLLTPAGEG
ncbi:MAG: hypothetical protein ABR509_08525 [Candidatus Limnocylindria bacterium]